MRISKHGWYGTAEYEAWCNMLSRCRNPKKRDFKHYGARGIQVCERWLSFENFIEDLGPKPSPAHSLDRVDNDGDYNQSNCRWANWSAQNRNKRNNRIITHQDVTHCITEWSEITGISTQTIRWRLRSGWPIDRTLTQPTQRNSS